MRIKKSLLANAEPRSHPSDAFELSTSLILRIHQKAVEGDSQVLEELGFSEDMIHDVALLTSHELNHLINLRYGFLTHEIKQGQLCIEFDAQRLRAIIIHVRRELRHEQLQDELIRLMAPWPLMWLLFRMGKHEFVARRKSLGLAGVNTGGSLGLPEAQQEAVWACWRRYVTLAQGERCLQVARELGLTLNRIWPVIKSQELWNCALTGNKVNAHLIQQPLRGHSPRERERRLNIVA